MTTYVSIRLGPRLAVCLCGIMMLTIYALLFLGYLPNSQGTAGHDYSFYLPNLLSGYYWYLENGPWQIPWFTPAICGGFPYYPDPNGAFFSVPQFLSFVVPPITAIRWTVLLFAGLGFGGFYALLRNGFAASRTAAFLTASFFMFNGFFTFRLLAGHLTFHAYMLLPVVAAAVINSARQTSISLQQALARVAVAGLALAYMIHSGMNHVVPPVLLTITIILLLQALVFGWRWTPWLRFIAAGLLALALFAGKLNAEFSLLANFPRDYYPLPGIRDLATTFWLVFRTVFFEVPAYAPRSIVNSQWMLDRHEWEYGVSPAPLLFIVSATLLAVVNRVRLRNWPTLSLAHLLLLLASLVLLAIPIALNYYQPEWNHFLKGLPLIGNSSNLLRWFSVYTAVAVLLAGIALDRLPLPTAVAPLLRKILASAGIAFMLFSNMKADHSFYANQSYPVTNIDNAWKVAATKHATTPIENIVARNPLVGTGPNDGLTKGYSAIMCYQPLMGYRLEKFPVGALHPGPIILADSDTINLKNPACYLFPAENNCQPGDHFLSAERQAAEHFAAYQAFDFKESARQRFADQLSFAALLLAGLLLINWLVFLLRERH